MSRSITKSVVFFHISDFHFRVTELLKSQMEDVLRSLLKKLEQVVDREPQWTPELVLCTGDVAWSGKPEEYQVAQEYFSDLLTALRLNKNQFFVVPGNHDVNVDKVTDFQKDVIRELLDARRNEYLTKSDAFFEDKDLLRAFLDKFRGYNQFVQEYLGRPIDENDGYYFSEVVVAKSGLRIGVVGLNSAWAFECSDRRIEYGRQLLGRWPLLRALKRLVTLGDADLKVAMFHHPVQWLPDYGQGPITRLLAQSVQLILQGHQDFPDQQFCIIGAGEKRALVLQEGPAFKDAYYPNRVELVRCEALRNRLVSEVYSLEYDPDGLEWVLDTKTFASHGRQDYHGLFTVPRILPNLISPPLRGRRKRQTLIKAGVKQDTTTEIERPTSLGIQEYYQKIVSEIAAYNPREESLDYQGTILSGYIHEDLVRYYVSPPLVRHRGQTRDAALDGIPAILDMLCEERPCTIFIVGDSGVGKSSLLLRLLYEICATSGKIKQSASMLPVFIPLREYAADKTFVDFVHDLVVGRSRLAFNLDNLLKSLKQGSMLLLLDGLDEIPGRDYRFLPELIRTARKLIVTAKKTLINSVDDLEIYAFSEHDFLAGKGKLEQVRLFEIMEFDHPRRKRYLKLKGCVEVDSQLQQQSLEPITTNTIVLRFIADQPEILSISKTLTDVYTAYASRMTAWYCLRHVDKAGDWLNRDYVNQFIRTLALDCYERHTVGFDTISPILKNQPPGRLNVLLENPLFTRSPASIYEFRHPSWVAYYVAQAMYREICLHHQEFLGKVIVDRSVSVFTREMVTSEDIPILVSQIQAAVHGHNDALLFNLSHMLQSYFLHRGFVEFNDSERTEVLTTLRPLASIGDIIVEGYFCRILAQVQGSNAMAEHIEKLRSSPVLKQRNLELFLRYNRDVDGLVSQMLRHLKQASTYRYCVLLDLFVIESALPLLKPRHGILLDKALRSAKPHHEEQICTHIDFLLEYFKNKSGVS
jgi:hypothetical protein